MSGHTPAMDALDARDAAFAVELKRIGEEIGYGNAQSILGRLWDELLSDEYGAPPGRGGMGVTIDDALPPIPKAEKLRREAMSNGGYQMVPAYTVAELKVFAHAAIAKAATDPKTRAAPAMYKALENVRLLAARHRKEEWAQHMLRFCDEAGVTGSPLRAAALSDGKKR